MTSDQAKYLSRLNKVSLRIRVAVLLFAAIKNSIEI